MRNGETVWEFVTARFCVRLEIAQDYGYRYDGDDEDGETQRALDSGEYVAFDSRVVVELDGREIASDSLGGSVYGANQVREFWTAHRDPDFMNRNCGAMRLARGGSVDAKYSICHYFPSMVMEAIAMARNVIWGMQEKPRLRA